jgi:hypothetical protein
MKGKREKSRIYVFWPLIVVAYCMWPKGERLNALESYWLEDMSNGLEGLSMAVLTRGAGMAKEEVMELTSKVRENLKDKRIHAYCPV